MCCSSDIFLGFLALLFPPLPVWVKCGLCSGDSVLNIFLCMLGYVPGLLHAWYIIIKNPENIGNYGTYDSETGRVTYVIVDQDGDDEAAGRGARQQQHRRPLAGAAGRHQPHHNHQQQARPKSGSQPGRQANMSYGTAASDNAGQSSSSAAAAPPPAQGYLPGDEVSGDDLLPPPSYAQVMGDNKIQDRS